MHRSPAQTNLFPTYSKPSSPWNSECSLRRDLGGYSSSSSSEFGEHLSLFHKLDYLKTSPLAGLYEQITHSTPNIHKMEKNEESEGEKPKRLTKQSSVEEGEFKI